MASRSEFDINLINAVRDRPILWDPRFDDYKLAEKKPQEWMSIAEILNSDVSKCISDIDLKSVLSNSSIVNHTRIYTTKTSNWRVI